jgi:ABC-2 type transport system permease protein
MNAPSNAVPQSAVVAQADATKEISAMQTFSWCVKRELWENRYLYLAPLAVASVFLLGFLVSTIHLPQKIRAFGPTPVEQGTVFAQTFDFAALALMGTEFLVALFYCVEALYSERRDRSILFWKSLPVSDAMTVLAKASVPLVLLPLLTFILSFALQCVMLLVSSAVFLSSGQAAVLSHLSLGMRWTGLFFHLVGGHGLYYAPIYGWLLLVSAWSRRAPFLWAALPPFGVGILEKILFNTSHFASILNGRISGGPDPFPGTSPGAKATGVDAMIMMHSSFSEYLISPSFWMGLALTAILLMAAVRLRRYRGPN